MNKRILSLAIPNIISNLSVPMLSAVDTALMGRLENEQYLGAIAIGGVIFGFVYWGFSFLRMGVTGLTAQAYGARDSEETTLILKRGVMVALLIALLLLLLQPLIAVLSFYLMDAGPEVEMLARSYFHIRLCAAPATLTLHVFHGWFLGMQNAKYPMVLTIVVNLFNLVLNFFFVKVLMMTSDGVALGTVIAQYLGLLCTIGLFLRRYRHLWDGWHLKGVLHPPALKRFFRIGRDIIIRTFSVLFCHAFFTSKAGALSDTALAVNTILMQFIHILAYGIDGFAFAAEALVGRYRGAREVVTLKRSVRYSFCWALLLSLGFSLVFGLFGTKLLYLFTDKTNLLIGARPYLIWIAIAPPINSIAYIWDGVFVGATATTAMRNSMLASALVFLLAYFVLKGLGNHGLWMALTLFSAARGATLTFFAPKHIFSLNVPQKQESPQKNSA
ncbi:MATE family efflux transporter [Candidatus Poribacteria bacterium]|nr:MAG: MATE family efflux transporter [Candidatus Poribacteria bacterium]